MEEWRYLTQSLFSSKVLTEYPSYLEPGREAERVRRQEGGEGVAAVRAVMLRLPGVNILQINRLFEQKIGLKNEKFGVTFRFMNYHRQFSSFQLFSAFSNHIRFV